jgi:hypothetical protein
MGLAQETARVVDMFDYFGADDKVKAAVQRALPGRPWRRPAGR